MFKLFMRAQVKWFGGFSRYADLCLSMALSVIAYYQNSAWTLAFACLGLISFIFDFNGKIQRFTLNSALANVGPRRK